MWTLLLHTICKHLFTKMAARGHMHLPKCHMQPFHTWGSDSDGLSQFRKGAGGPTDKFPCCCHCLPSENLPRPLIVSGSPNDAIRTAEREEDDYLWSWPLFTAGSICDIRKRVKLNPQNKILRTAGIPGRESWNLAEASTQCCYISLCAAPLSWVWWLRGKNILSLDPGMSYGLKWSSLALLSEDYLLKVQQKWDVRSLTFRSSWISLQPMPGWQHSSLPSAEKNR